MFYRFTIILVLTGVVFCSPVLAKEPNDPLFNEQWYLRSIEAPGAWDTTTGSKQVVVAVLDTGVDFDHPDLASNIWRNQGEVAGDGLDNDRNGFVDDTWGWNFVENNNDPRPVVNSGATPEALNHGTLISGIIAAVGNNREGIAGLGWQTQIMSVRVLDSQGVGFAESVVDGIRYAARNGADVINLSFTTEEPSPEFTEVIKYAHDAGVIVVAAIGNMAKSGLNTDQTPIYPACVDGPAGENWILGVAALNTRNKKSSFSNYGSMCVDLSAPGEEILSTQFFMPKVFGDRSYGDSWAGTSLAAPMVSGTAALVRAVAPRLRRDDIIDILLKTAIPLDDLNPDYRGKLGRGKVNSQAAVVLASEKAKRTIKATLAVSGEAGPPRVWLFNDQGTLISGFLAYDEAFRGGVRLASGDVDNDNEIEIITAPGSGASALIRIFEGQGSLKDEFLAFEDKNGVFIAAGDLTGDQAAEIVVAAGPGSTPRVRVFDHTGQLRSEFLAYDQSFTGGVEVSIGDTDGDGVSEIITGVHGKGGPHIRIFDWRGNLKGQFFAFEETYGNGVRLGLADVGGPVGEEILVTRGGGETARLHELRSNGNSWNSIIVFAEDQDGPISIAARQSATHLSELFVAGGKTGQFPLIHGFTPIGALISSFPVPVELGTALHIATL